MGHVLGSKRRSPILLDNITTTCTRNVEKSETHDVSCEFISPFIPRATGYLDFRNNHRFMQCLLRVTKANKEMGNLLSGLLPGSDQPWKPQPSTLSNVFPPMRVVSTLFPLSVLGNKCFFPCSTTSVYVCCLVLITSNVKAVKMDE